MPRYIDADKIDYTVTIVGEAEYAGYRAVAFESDIDEIPTADVMEVKHGEWKGKPIAGYGNIRCSVCNTVFLNQTGNWQYCPNCGADMHGNSG